MLLRSALFAACLGATLANPAWAQRDHAGPPAGAGTAHQVPADQAPAGQAPAGQAPAAQAMMAGMGKMDHDMAAAPMTGNPDHDFAVMMLPHHQGAIDMARVELRYGKDPTMRRLAQDIVAAQEREIAMIRRWLASGPAQ